MIASPGNCATICDVKLPPLLGILEWHRVQSPHKTPAKDFRRLCLPRCLSQMNR